jgi:hypothetical protein
VPHARVEAGYCEFPPTPLKTLFTDHGVAVRFAPWSVECGNAHMLTLPDRQVSSLRTLWA